MKASSSLPQTDETRDFLIAANERQTLIRHGESPEPPSLLPETLLQLYPSPVIDGETLRVVQVLQLHRAIDRTQSATGAAVLLRSLIRPSTDPARIRDKQEALREIASSDSLRRALSGFLSEFSRREGALYRFLNKGIFASFPYRDIQRARRCAAVIAGLPQSLPSVRTPYLRALMSRLDAYRRSPLHSMMEEAVFRTLGGLRPKSEVGFFTPKRRFVPRRFTRWIAAGPAAAAAPHVLPHIGFDAPVSGAMTVLGLAWTGLYLFYAMFLKPVRDTENVVEPLRRKCVADDAFGLAVEAVGRLDELLSIDTWAGELPHAVVLPEVEDGGRHFFSAKGLKNPVLAAFQTDVVANDVSLVDAGLTFVTGPNSGGKTTVCKSVVHNQLLAQMGSYVLAEEAAVGIADRIAYQAPAFDGLQDAEGRFGTELARTRDIFFSTGPKSLVILDELAEGTTREEKLRESYGILSDFHTIGNNTVLVTHNHALVDRFAQEGRGQALRAEFRGDEPTYRMVPGVSRVSHAEKTAERIHFSAEDRRRYLKDKGYG